MASRENENREPPPDTIPPAADSGWAADLDLVRGTLAGRSAATETFVARMICIPRILDALTRASRPFRTAEERRETVQEVFARVWGARHRFEGRSSLETWVYRFCVLTLVELRRRGARTPGQFDVDPDHWVIDPRGTSGITGSDALLLRAAVERLDPSESEIVSDKHFAELTFEEIAQRLAISPNTAKTRYYRALRSLRQWLRRSFGGDGGRSDAQGGVE
ncbi:MAG: sigma-70 family RNA polymerase sigma factor [Planctomycetota bacterium]